MSNNNYPKAVYQALELAKELEFTSSCIPEVGQLLNVLVAQADAGTIAEIGTGCGVASAWILDALRPNQHFISIELDPIKHQAVSNMLTHPQAIFICAGWKTILIHAPFTLVFVDIAEAKDDAFERVIAATAINGLIFLDDFTPEKFQPSEWKRKPDKRREQWLNHPNLIACEILTTDRTSAIFATRYR